MRLFSSALVASGLALNAAAQAVAPPPAPSAPPNAGNATTPLEPVPDPNLNRADPKNIETTKNITMVWNQTQTGSVEVKGNMKFPTVMLENIGSIKQVNCDDKTIMITFQDENSRKLANEKWPKTEFLVVTNAQGQCDEPAERGVYLTSNPKLAEGSPVITFDRRRESFNETVDSLEITFDSVSSPTQVQKRAEFDINKVLNHSFAIPNVELSAADLPVLVEVLPGQASFDMVFTGKVKTEGSKVTECFFDVKTKGDVSMGVAVAMQKEFKKDFNQPFGKIPLSPFNIPGILNIGPAIEPSVGFELVGTGNVKAEFEVKAGYKETQFHLDVLDRSKTFSTPFEPFFNGSANIGASVKLEANPYLDVKFSLEIDTPAGGARAGLGSTLKLKNSLLVDGRTGDPDEAKGIDKGKIGLPPLLGKPASAGGAKKPAGGKPGQDPPVDTKKLSVAVEKEDPQSCANGASLKSELGMNIYAFAEAKAVGFGQIDATYTFVDNSWELFQRCYSFLPANQTTWKIDQPKTVPGRKMRPMPALAPTADIRKCKGDDYQKTLRLTASNLFDARADSKDPADQIVVEALRQVTAQVEQCFPKDQVETVALWAKTKWIKTKPQATG
ncbi:hypothetical protein HIM_03716 [Hirsutella minnesotensis 3608]|uniref:DUF7029 domain-containing protein n=1 Tax=Hirsutella minnesotensis 3608 TaxID=1043627 RepID=A0A0F8A6C5_9HYPO|nr:hypothetical protein HIM_03716 [Hirsutella minnesotensis 3608]